MPLKICLSLELLVAPSLTACPNTGLGNLLLPLRSKLLFRGHFLPMGGLKMGTRVVALNNDVNGLKRRFLPPPSGEL